MLDELLQKAVALYVPRQHRDAALVTFRRLLSAASAEGANAAVSELTTAVRKDGAK
jgi:hypothetical protein